MKYWTGMPEPTKEVWVDEGLSHKGASTSCDLAGESPSDRIESHISIIFERDGDSFEDRMGMGLRGVVRQMVETADFHGSDRVSARVTELAERLSLDEERVGAMLGSLTKEQLDLIRHTLLSSGLSIRKPEIDPPSRNYVEDSNLSQRIADVSLMTADQWVANAGLAIEFRSAETLNLPDIVEAPKLYKIGTAIIAGDHTTLTMVGNSSIIDSDHLWQYHGSHFIPRLQAGLAESYHLTTKAGEYVSLAGQSGENFWHFMAENLPKVVVAEEVGFDGKYIIPNEDRFPYAKQALELLGIPESRIERFDGGCWEVETLWVPSHLSLWESDDEQEKDRRGSHPWLLKEVRNRLLAGVQEQSDMAEFAAPKRIWIERGIATRAHEFLNRDEVKNVLDSYGFKQVDMGSLPLAEQIHYASHAECLVGQHGAAMVHMLFLSEEASAVEFYSTGYVVNFDMPVRNANSFQYEGLVWAPTKEDRRSASGDLRVAPGSPDVQVNTRALRSTLRRFLEPDTLP